MRVYKGTNGTGTFIDQEPFFSKLKPNIKNMVLICFVKQTLSWLIGTLGPLVRIGVNELHVNDPEFFQDVTKMGSRFLKEPGFYRGISCPNSSIGLVDPVKHRVRRHLLVPAFSQARVEELSPSLEQKVSQLRNKLQVLASLSTAIDLAGALKCLTLDVISGVVFGQDFFALESNNFSHPQLKSLQRTLEGAWIFRTFPTLSKLSLSLPNYISSTVFLVPIVEFGKVSSLETSSASVSIRNNSTVKLELKNIPVNEPRVSCRRVQNRPSFPVSSADARIQKTRKSPL